MKSDQQQLNEAGRQEWNQKAAFWDALPGAEGNDFHRYLIGPAVERESGCWISLAAVGCWLALEPGYADPAHPLSWDNLWQIPPVLVGRLRSEGLANRPLFWRWPCLNKAQIVCNTRGVMGEIYFDD